MGGGGYLEGSPQLGCCPSTELDSSQTPHWQSTLFRGGCLFHGQSHVEPKGAECPV